MLARPVVQFLSPCFAFGVCHVSSPQERVCRRLPCDGSTITGVFRHVFREVRHVCRQPVRALCASRVPRCPVRAPRRRDEPEPARCRASIGGRSAPQCRCHCRLHLGLWPRLRGAGVQCALGGGCRTRTASHRAAHRAEPPASDRNHKSKKWGSGRDTRCRFG